VSAAKVFELLPRIPLPEALGVRVMSCFADPELLPYRRYVARRSGALDAAGFPVAAARNTRKWPQALAGAMAAVATVVAIAVIFQQFGRVDGGVPGIASAAFPEPGQPPGIRLPWQSEPRDVPISVEPILDSRATLPLGALATTTPATGPTPPAQSTPETRETPKDKTTPQPEATPTPDHQSAEPEQEPDKLPDKRPGDHPHKHPHKRHHPEQTPSLTDSPTPAPPPTVTPIATPIVTPIATPIVTPIATPTVVPAQTPTAPPIVPAG